jgi:hypothetical protein
VPAALTQGPTFEHAGPSITPLLGDDEATCDYLTLDEALEAAARRSRRRCAQFASGRAEKMKQVSLSLAASGDRAADQGAVWEAIAAKAGRMGVRSRRSAMAAIFDQHVDAIDSYITAFTPLDRQGGALFAVHGQLAGVEIFDRAGTWRRLAPKLIRSYAIEALEPAQAGERLDAQPESLLGCVLASVTQAESRSFPALSLGVDLRFESAGITGAALVADGRVLHLAAFADMARRGQRAPGWMV